MIHGPCDVRCLKNERCINGYPKPYNIETRVNRDGYPVYKRSPRTRQHESERSGFTATNQHVVPYNPYLCQKYNAHINVEICTSARAIKYLCMYITKGTDRAQLQTQDSSADPDQANEVVQYQNARYIGPCEAVWRTFEFKVHIHDPMVLRLDFHLPDEQIVRFRGDMTPEQLQAARDAAASGTKILAFFELCLNDEAARQYLYTEILCHYTWNTRSHQWHPRTNPHVKLVVTRIYSASLSNMPLYCLRLLLLHVRGPTSFQAIRTYQDIVYDTFQEAAVARGLLESDNEWNRCLDEASQSAPSASAIRALFIYILINCSPADPLTFWATYRERMAEDYFYALCSMLRTNEEELTPEQITQIYQHTLGDIESHLQVTGHHLSEFPSLPQDFVAELDLLPPLEALEIVERRQYNAVEQHDLRESLLHTLNHNQRHAFNTIAGAIDAPTAPTPRIFFVNGPGGTGKSQLFKTLLSYVRGRNQVALPVASSGIAALLLPGGRTAHSRFKIPLNTNASTTCNMRLNGPHAYLIRQSSLIIWDEVVMCSKHNFEAVDRSHRDIMGAIDPMFNNVLFGGKVFVLGGDFRQLLPSSKEEPDHKF